MELVTTSDQVAQLPVGTVLRVCGPLEVLAEKRANVFRGGQPGWCIDGVGVMRDVGLFRYGRVWTTQQAGTTAPALAHAGWLREPDLIETDAEGSLGEIEELRRQLKQARAELDAANSEGARLARVEKVARALLGRQRLDEALAALDAVPAAETGEAWGYGDVHRCGASSYPHAADAQCVTYALQHGDRTYRRYRSDRAPS